MICPVKPIDSVVNVVGGMRVDYVNDDEQTHAMGLVNQILEVVRGALARARGKVARHMVAERSIVRVLLDCHELNAVVATLFNVWKNLIGEFAVLGHASVLR